MRPVGELGLNRTQALPGALRAAIAAAVAGLILIGTSAVATAATMGRAAPIPRERPQASAANQPDTADSVASDFENLVTDPIDTWSPIETQAANFASDLTTRALALLDNTALATGERLKAFRKLVSDVFDVRAIGGLLLGHNKDKLDERQLADYQSIVANYIVPIYAARIGQICDTQPSVVSVSQGNGGMIVRTAFMTRIDVPPTYVDWLVAQQPDNSWRVLDISVNGVSIAHSKIDEFSAVIAQRGPDAFLELLHDQAGDGLPQPMSAPLMPPSIEPAVAKSAS